MTFKTKIKIIVLLCCAFAAALIVGCSVGQTSVEDFLKSKNAREQCVYYYANGGNFSGSLTTSVKSVYYAEGTPIVDGVTVTAKTTALTVVRTDYIFDGWQTGETDENGDPVFDDNGYLVLTGENFTSRNIEKGETLYLGAVWTEDVAVKIVLVADDGFTLKDADDNTYVTGDTIVTGNFGSQSSYTLDNSKTPLTSKNGTFLQYYRDAECTDPYTSTSTSLAKPTDGNDIIVYAKYIEGVYTVVTTAKNVQTMFNGRRNSTAYYLYSYTGDREIDCSSVAFTFTSSDTKFKIYGNGFTLKNLSFTETSASNGESLSMFGKLTSEAVIEDITFENVTMTVTGRGSITFYALFLSVEEGATLSDVSISGLTCAITYPAGGTYFLNNNRDMSSGWLCGAYDSDEEFFVNFDISLTGASLTVNSTAVVEDKSYNNG